VLERGVERGKWKVGGCILVFYVPFVDLKPGFEKI
jgi:hypothetical protein